MSRKHCPLHQVAWAGELRPRRSGTPNLPTRRWFRLGALVSVLLLLSPTLPLLIPVTLGLLVVTVLSGLGMRRHGRARACWPLLAGVPAAALVGVALWT